MNYQEFVEEIKKRAHDELGYPTELMRYYPEGYTSTDPIEINWIQESNERYMNQTSDTVLTDLLFLFTNKGDVVTMVQRIAVKQSYDSCGGDVDIAFAGIRKAHSEIDAAKVSRETLELRLTDAYSDIRDHLIVRPLNYQKNCPELSKYVYRRIGDVALVLYQILGDADHTLTTSKIRRSELDRWGVTPQEALDNALENTARIYPACVYDQRVSQEVDLLSGDFSKEDLMLLPGTFAVSTFKTTNGAAALFYPGVVQKLMTIMGGPFVAVFMNINDTMIFAVEDSKSKEMARKAGKPGPFGEMLSGKRYRCDENGVTPID